jgi:hypothetical protein
VSRKSPLIALVLAFALFAAGCGGEDSGSVVEAAAEQASGQNPVEPESGSGDSEGEGLFDEPIPVEPDGGIGDGAEPLPGAEEPVYEGTWHGPDVPPTNCPGMEWVRVDAGTFSFSLPSDFTEVDVQGIDSQIGEWVGGNNIVVSFDYGWYSGSLSAQPGAENEPVDFTGIVGERTVIRDGADKYVSILFPEVVLDGDQWNRLGMNVRFDDVNDEIIGRCIVRSITWPAE